MRFSFLRSLQWLGVAVALFAVVGLTYDFDSEAGKMVNAPIEDSLSQSLLGYWKMDEGTGTSTTADSSGNSNNLTMTAMEEGDWVAGTIGAYSLDFDGSAEWLTVADPSSGILDMVDGADFSISGWFNRDLFAADHTIVAKKNDQTTNQGYVVWIDNNGSTDYLNFQISDGTDTYTAVGATDMSATGWHHFTVVWNDGTGMYIYLDGKLDGSTTTSTSSVNSLANALAFRIGAESDNGVPFDGRIDDVKLYGRALSASEVSRLYQTTVPGNPVNIGLVGHWTFDGNDVNWGDMSNEIKDVSGKGNHGNALGSLATTSVTPGKLGQGLSFNGTSDYVNVGSSSSISNLASFSVSLWVKPSSLTNNETIASTYAWRFYFDTSGTNKIAFYRATNSIWLEAKTSNNVFSSNSWIHMVVTTTGYTGTDTHIFVNGSEVGYSMRTSGTDTFLSDDNLFIGAHSWNASFKFTGNIDDVRMYNRVLSSGEVINLYNFGK